MMNVLQMQKGTRVGPWTLLALCAFGLVSVIVTGLLQSSNVLAQSEARTVDGGIVVDGHVHITNRVFYEGIDPWQPQVTGLWDYARAKQGGLNVVIEHVHIEDEYNNYNMAVKQAVRLVETFHRVLDGHRDKMELALSSADIRRIVASGKTAVVLALEGSPDMEGDLDVLRLFFRLGVRMMQLSNHNTTNAYIDAEDGEQKWGGINDRGRAVIREMNRLGMVVDISHSSEEAQLQVIETSLAPVVDSHTGLQHFTPRRGTSDRVLKMLAAKGGVIGIYANAWALSRRMNEWRSAGPQRPDRMGQFATVSNFFRPPTEEYGTYLDKLDLEMRARWKAGYLTPWKDRELADAPLPTLEDWAEQVDHVVRVVGPNHVGIGWDMMDGGRNLRGADATSYRSALQALIARGVSSNNVRKIAGENWLRALDSAKVATIP